MTRSTPPGTVDDLIRRTARAAGVPAAAVIGDAVLTLEVIDERGDVAEYVVAPGELTGRTACMLDRATQTVSRASHTRNG